LPESFRGGCSFGTGNPDSPYVDGCEPNAAIRHRQDLYSMACTGKPKNMSTEFVFGYGSLVNRATHAYPDVHAARLTGWRRQWRRSATRPVTYLSAVPDADSWIDGLILAVPAADTALDQREAAYARQDVTEQVHHPAPNAANIDVFAIQWSASDPGRQPHPILLSYIDVVVQGYFQEYGEPGVRHFFETTDGWDTPVLNDRADPQYPRNKTLTPHEEQLTDDWLARLATVVKQG